ncbi:MAG: hypothetical protein H0V89_02955 [Deltaproteobacteria bacterium]|nr:hypothetical protein [Deltaproteobacteria bacterium]
MPVIVLVLACEGEPPPAPARDPLPPLVIAACPPVPDDVLATLGPARAAEPLEIADRVARGGPGARCPWSEDGAGHGAVFTFRDDTPGITFLRRWPDAPAEILLSRPVPLDAEGRIAASLAWTASGATLTWWDVIAAPCAEEIGPWDPAPAIRWTCADRPAPRVESGIPWPDPVDR